MKRTIRLTLCLLLLSALAFLLPQGGALAAGNLIADYAGMLSSEQVSELSAEANRISNEYGCDTAVVFVRGLNGYTSIMDFTEDFFINNGYGRGSSRDGVMLLVDVQGREYWISTSGFGIYAFTDQGQLYIKDRFVPSLSGGDWAGAAKAFLTQCDRFLKQAKNGEPYDVGNMPKTYFSPLGLLGTGLFGALAGGLPLHSAKKQMKNVGTKRDADEYVTGQAPNLQVREDRFLGSHVTRVPIPRDTGDSRGGGGGGSSTHTHSSGNTFGGSGGKF